MLRVGFILTGLIALYGVVWVWTADDEFLGEVQFLFMMVTGGIAIIVIWVSIAIASAIRAGRQLQKEMHEEGWPGRPDA